MTHKNAPPNRHPQNKKIKRENAHIWFDENEGGKIYNLSVLDFRQRSQTGYRGAQKCDMGASTSYWLSDYYHSPEGLYMLFQYDWHGFANPYEHLRALKELSKISGCNWASKMASTLEELNNER